VALTAVLVGAGNRGRWVYGRWALAHPERLRIVAVAEPNDAARAAFAAEHAIAPEHVHRDWSEVLDGPKRADVAIIATGDTLHTEPALAAIERGYHLLLEKPIAPTPAECVRVVEAAEESVAVGEGSGGGCARERSLRHDDMHDEGRRSVLSDVAARVA